jgi:hypothetical protein
MFLRVLAYRLVEGLFSTMRGRGALRGGYLIMFLNLHYKCFMWKLSIYTFKHVITTKNKRRLEQSDFEMSAKLLDARYRKQKPNTSEYWFLKLLEIIIDFWNTGNQLWNKTMLNYYMKQNRLGTSKIRTVKNIVRG